MKLINLTPHVIRLRLGHRQENSFSTEARPERGDVEIQSTGIARVRTSTTEIDVLHAHPRVTEGRDLGQDYASGKLAIGEEISVPIYAHRYGDVEGLPPPEHNTYYIVSLFVAQALPERADLLGPATGPSDNAVRDAEGRIYAVRGLQSYAGKLAYGSAS